MREPLTINLAPMTGSEISWHMDGNEIIVDKSTFDPLETIAVVQALWPSWMRDQERGSTDA